MGLSFSTLVYLSCQDMFSVPVEFKLVKSNPGVGFMGRGIFDTVQYKVMALDNSIYSDQRTILDIRESEFSLMPLRGDRVVVPSDCNGVDQGEWEIIDSDTNGGGETTLTLRKWEGG